MRLTIVGSGDAFGSGGRSNTCFWLETNKGVVVVDFGASALPALKKLQLDPNAIDAIVLSHLHGDHFGGLPFLLLDAQFLSRRAKPLLIAGPPGTKARLVAAMDVFFPKSTGSKLKFEWRVQEIAVGVETDVLGHSLVTAEVIHQSGAPSTALRLSDGCTIFAYSGDTEWTDAVLPIARGADLDIDDLLRRSVIHALMCRFALDMSAVEDQYAIDFDSYFEAELEQLETLARDGLIELGGGWIRVTPRGRLLVRNVAMVFDRGLRAGAQRARYSKVI
jgi:phosphoribosyl 1,2-cyclic phosphodiesterase